MFGATDFATPRIDRMASEGMRFTSFYAQVLCGPSRTALLAGSYPARCAGSTATRSAIEESPTSASG